VEIEECREKKGKIRNFCYSEEINEEKNVEGKGDISPH